MQQFFTSYSVFCRFKTFGYLVKRNKKEQKQQIQYHLYRCATQAKLLEKLKSKHILKQ